MVILAYLKGIHGLELNAPMVSLRESRQCKFVFGLELEELMSDMIDYSKIVYGTNELK